MVACGRVEGAAVVPNGYHGNHVSIEFINAIIVSIANRTSGRLTKIVGVFPAESTLNVMVLGNQPHELVHNLRAFHVRHVVDAEAIGADREQALPTRKRMRANNRVVRLEVQPCIARGTAGAAVHSARVFFSGLGEGGGFVCGR